MDRLIAEKSRCENEIVIENRCVKTFGQNYQAVKVKKRLKLGTFVKLLTGFFAAAFVVLGVLVLCGI